MSNEGAGSESDLLRMAGGDDDGGAALSKAYQRQQQEAKFKKIKIRNFKC